MFDLKMDAPAEIRGEFQPISTKVPGIQICEHLPRMAAMMDKLAIIRSLVGSEGRHASFQCMTGWPVQQQPVGGWPSFGSAVAKLQGTTDGGTPPYVNLSPKMKGSPWADPGQAGYGDAGPLLNDYFLAARRLVEAGVRVVSLAYGRSDWHGRPHGTNFDNARDHLPALDQGVCTLIEDLESRGMLKDTTVLVWGEFGRTPRINKNGGRGHWSNVAHALPARGG